MAAWRRRNLGQLRTGRAKRSIEKEAGDPHQVSLIYKNEGYTFYWQLVSSSVANTKSHQRMEADADCAQINPFVFKNKARHRFSDKSQKYLLKRSLEEKKDKKRLARIVKLRRINLNRYITVKQNGTKWWQRTLSLYYSDVNEADIVGCKQNTTSEVMLQFEAIRGESKTYFQLVTFRNSPRLADPTIIRILFHGISTEEDEEDTFELVGYRATRREMSEDCFIVEPTGRAEQPSVKLSVIKFQNLQHEHDIRSQYHRNVELTYVQSLTDPETILNVITYNEKFKNSGYTHIETEMTLLTQELNNFHKRNHHLWDGVLHQYLEFQKRQNEIKESEREVLGLVEKLACRNRLLFIKQGLADKTEDELEEALQELQLQEKRLIYSRRNKKSRIASYNDCKVCFFPEVRQDNLIIFCVACRTSYHLNCYGLDNVDDPDNYVCDVCQRMEEMDWEYFDSRRPSCAACLTRPDLPLKLVNSEFYHPACLFLFQHADPKSLPIRLKKAADQTMKDQLSKEGKYCSYCLPRQKRYGLRLRCSQQGCPIHMHPICAYLSGCKFNTVRSQELSCSIVCQFHTFKGQFEEELRQVYLRRFFCNYGNIQKLNEEEFKPLYQEEKHNIDLQTRYVHRDGILSPPLRKKRIPQQSSHRLPNRNHDLFIFLFLLNLIGSMLTRGFSLLRTLSQAAPAHSFCVSTQPSQTPTKTYRMPERKQIDLYKPEFPLRLHNYRVLLFANKQSLITPTLLQGHLGVSFVALIYLIRNNPWYLTFPASLPIMMGAELFIFFRWIFHKRHYKYIIERVYLEEGNVVEFVFSNKIRRKLKDTENSHIFNDPEELVTPDQGASGEEWTERGFPFPKELKYTLNEATREVECLPPAKPMFYGWTKYCANFQNYIFPKNYEYANWEILVPLLQGRYIDFEESTNQIHELPAGEDYAPMEQEMQWLKRDAQTNAESRKGRVQKGE